MIVYQFIYLSVYLSIYFLNRLAMAHSMYGKLLQEQGQYDKAHEMFEKASEYRPEDKENITRRWVVIHLSEKVTNKVDSFTYSLPFLSPRMACLLSLQRYEECLAMIKQELLSDNSNPDLYVLRAQINLLFGNVGPTLTLATPLSHAHSTTQQAR